MPATCANVDEKWALDHRCWAPKRVLKTRVQTGIWVRELTLQLEVVSVLPGLQVCFPHVSPQPFVTLVLRDPMSSSLWALNICAALTCMQSKHTCM